MVFLLTNQLKNAVDMMNAINTDIQKAKIVVLKRLAINIVMSLVMCS